MIFANYFFDIAGLVVAELFIPVCSSTFENRLIDFILPNYVNIYPVYYDK